MPVQPFPAGNYRFIPAVFQYSSGAAADPGFEVERVRFDNLLPLAQGFAQAAAYIQAAGERNSQAQNEVSGRPAASIYLAA